MEDNKNTPNFPSNYLTLSQLQERWIKEQQDQKQKEKQEEDQRHRENHQNEHFVPNIRPQNQKQVKDPPANQPNEDRKFQRRNWKLKATISGVSPEENSVVEGNGIETSVNETNSKTSGVTGMNEKRRKNKKNQKEKQKIMKDGEAMTEREGGIVVPETPAPPVTSETENIPAKWNGTKEDTRLVYRPKSTCTVEKSDGRVNMVGHVSNVVEDSKENVEIERKLRHLCIKKENQGSEIQNSTVNQSYTECRGSNRIFNRSNSKYSGRNWNAYRGNTEYRSYNGSGNRRNWHYRGRYERDNYSMERSGMIWVKKEYAADATKGA